MAKLYFYYSAMNAGKSTVLLQSAHNYRERGMDVLLYQPSIDTRFGNGRIASRIGLSADSISFTPDTDLAEDINQRRHLLPNLRCILVDEAQFLTRAQVLQLASIADELPLPVLTYGLRTDFKAEPFEGSQYLLAWAEEIIEIKTICECGRKATMNMRIDINGNPLTHGNQIEIGGNERYITLCRRHFWQKIKRHEDRKLEAKAS
jgi:thymidine kinase